MLLVPYLFIKTLLSNIFFALFCEEFRIVSHHEDEQDNQGQYPLDVNFQSSGEFQPFARIGFCQEVVPAPTHFPAAEQDEDQTAKRQDVLAYKEVFQIQHCGVRAEGLEAAPQVIAQYTRHGQQNDGNDIDDDNFLSAGVCQVCGKGNDVLEHGNDSRERRKAHEQEEQRAPESAAGHVVEHVRQCDEDQGRPLTRVYAISEACREDDHTSHERYEGVQNGDEDGFPCQRTGFVDVTAEDGNGTDTDTQCEERLTQCSEKHFQQAVFFQCAKVGFQVEFQTSFAAFQQCGTHCQHDHQKQKHQHHDFGDLFYAGLQALRADGKAKKDNHYHKSSHQTGSAQHGVKGCADAFRIQPFKTAGSCFKEIVKHPASYCGVEHHQDVVAGHAEIFIPMPFGAFRLQYVHGARDTALAATANRKFRHQNGNPHEDQKGDVNQYKGRAAILSGDVGKFPHVPQPDCAACGNEDEAQSGGESFSFLFHK